MPATARRKPLFRVHHVLAREDGYDPDVIDRCLTTIRLALERRNHGAAHAAIDRCIERETGEPIGAASTIRVLPLCHRTASQLEENGLATIGDLRNGLARLVELANFGPRLVAECEAAIEWVDGSTRDWQI